MILIRMSLKMIVRSQDEVNSRERGLVAELNVAATVDKIFVLKNFHQNFGGQQLIRQIFSFAV